MEQNQQLTNESISKKFTNQFDLVNYAIKIAENLIRTGREPKVKIDSENKAMQVLAEISSEMNMPEETQETQEIKT